MKTRSTQLWQYLSDKGLLHSSPDDPRLQDARAEYRRLYKKRWKKTRQVATKELRPTFTQKNYYALKVRAREAGFKHPTSFIKQLVLASLASKPLVPDPTRLQKIFQLISMATIALTSPSVHTSPSEIRDNLLYAEDLLHLYLKEFGT
jgi:hypothetical protein